VIDCQAFDPYTLYSLQSEIYPFVFACPAGFNCNPKAGGPIYLACCDGFMSERTLPDNVTDDVYNAIVQGMIAECALHAPFGDCCDTKAQPLVLYGNAPQVCTKFCPSGAEFSYTVQPGRVMACTQALSDSTAQALSCQGALDNIICLSPIQEVCCQNQAYSSFISASGGGLALSPQTNQWSLASGTIPTGLSATFGSILGYQVPITGTPTATGTFGFTVQVSSPKGVIVNQPYIIAVVGYSPTSLPDAVIGTPYSQQLTALGVPLGKTVSFVITSGALPTGLTMTSAGLISGTPTGGIPATFTVVAVITP
jgi:hypothetical protein